MKEGAQDERFVSHRLRCKIATADVVLDGPAL